ncbi:hypothetical protein BSK48_17025 [Paenibacillus odorifer]|uniref:hypothetical protein n=1 Tax=Paenibacillus odorifer TaxID=189426 RepID=UPI00096CC4D8|nr:hypothetical protein [Paenibacillus odorifer]OMD69179.1 hypothetical protein BSK48_17025 [Paenibacillus odorifer]
MKLKITGAQLKELNDAQKEELRNWWEPKYGDELFNGHWEDIVDSFEKYDDEKGTGTIRTVSCDQDGSNDYENKSECLPLLNIGQMIEYLQSSEKQIYLNEADFYNQNLCDKLWEEVKDKLPNGKS